MDVLLIYAGWGFLGAVARLLSSFLSSFIAGTKIDISNSLFYSFVVLIIGAFSGIVLSYSVPISFLAGYAGLDLMDGYAKALKSKRVKIEGVNV